MQEPVAVGDMCRVEDTVLVLEGVALGEAVANEGGVDGPIDHHMGDVNVSRAQFTGHALGQRAQGMLGPGEGGEPSSASGASRGTGEEDRAALAHHHPPGNRLCGQEAGEAGHFPDLEILAGRFLENAARHIGADIEDKRLDRANVALDGLDQLRHLFFLAGIGAKTMGLAARSADLVHQGLQLLGLASCDAGGVPLAGETLGNFPSGGIAGTDHQHYFLLFCHDPPPLVNDHLVNERYVMIAPIVKSGREGFRMRYSTEHKQQTRERLLASSGALAKRGGFSSTGVAGLMKAIGLTGGAFYNHFPSKDDLFTEVVRQELCNSPLARLANRGTSKARLARCLEQYLSLAHLHNPEGGCPLPPLGVEIARAEPQVREEAEHWLVALHDAWSETLQDPQLAWVLISQCVGALVVGRMMVSEHVQTQVLDANRTFVDKALNEAL